MRLRVVLERERKVVCVCVCVRARPPEDTCLRAGKGRGEGGINIVTKDAVQNSHVPSREAQ